MSIVFTIKKKKKRRKTNFSKLISTLGCVDMYFKRILIYSNDLRFNLLIKVVPRTRHAHWFWFLRCHHYICDKTSLKFVRLQTSWKIFRSTCMVILIVKKCPFSDPMLNPVIKLSLGWLMDNYPLITLIFEKYFKLYLDTCLSHLWSTVQLNMSWLWRF